MILGTIYLIYGCKIASYYSNYTYLDSQEKMNLDRDSQLYRSAHSYYKTY